eukprot:TRINITY_DN8809_c0_g1_i1.p1 TRINITY_DN8809_c0_g1~~TRINITY_DN8809_c0_g1_i1.p1  ORF type:complete len:264 (-),score=57.36 TRINITY_DN8809_c0_g1_i1:87-878(-)
MVRKKTRNEINLSLLLDKTTELANNSQCIEEEWRLPKFVSAAEEMYSNLPELPDPAAPSSDERLQYHNQLLFLQTLVKNVKSVSFSDSISEDKVDANENVKKSVLLPQGPAFTRDTMSKQIAQKAAERAHQSQREQLFGKQNSDNVGQDFKQQDLDKLLAMHRDEQEKIAEEMISMTKRLKEQSMVAQTIIKEDTDRVDRINRKADENLSKLENEGGRISKLASRWNCRCWIWLAMFIVLLTFVGMVLLMKLFKKKIPVQTEL